MESVDLQIAHAAARRPREVGSEVGEQDLRLAVRTLWRDCLDGVRQRASPAEWDALRTRLAALERQMPD
jgi:hypothetical protein